MILRYHHLTRHPAVFRAMTGLAAAEFDALAGAVLPRLARAAHARLAARRGGGPSAGGASTSCRRATGCSW